MPRPSGIRHTPARASASGATPVTSRPQRNKLPERRRDLPRRDRERGRLARRRSGPSSAKTSPGASVEIDAVQHVDAAVARAHRGELQHGTRDPSSRELVTGSECHDVRPSRCRGTARCTDGVGLDLVRGALRDDAPEVEHVDVACTSPSRAACRARRGARRGRRRRARAAARRARRSRASSRPDDGSSSSSTFGLGRERAGELDEARGAGRQRVDLACRRPRAIPTRSSSSSATCAGVVALVAQRRRISSATSTFSRAVRLPNASSRWNVRAMPSRARRCGRLPVTSAPSSRTRPRLGCCKPGDDVEQRGLARAVRPDEPGHATGLDRDDASSTASRPPNETETSSMSSSGHRVSSVAPDRAARNVVADPEPAVDEQDVGLFERRARARARRPPARRCAAFSSSYSVLRVLAPRQEPRESFADRHDRARRVLDDAEHGEARREERRARATARGASSPG